MSLKTVLDEKNLTSLGWVPVPSINGKNCHTWADITQELERNDLSSIITGDWVSEPVVIKNQSLFKVRKDFVDNIAACSTGVRLILNVKKIGNLKVRIESIMLSKVMISNSRTGQLHTPSVWMVLWSIKCHKY